MERSKEETYLEISEPYFIIKDRKCEDVVDEGLRFACKGRNTKYLDGGQLDSDTIQRIRTCVKTSFVSRPHSVSSKDLSKLSNPLLPFRQLPVIFNSSMV